MADNDSSELGFQQRGDNHFNSPSSAMGTSWDHQVSELKSSAMGSHNHNPIGISPFSTGMLGNQGVTSSSHILRYSLDPNLLEISPKLSSYGIGSFSAMVNTFGLPEYDQITNVSCPDYLSTEETATNKNSRKVDDHGAKFHGDLHISDEGGSGSSPDAKKRKMPHYDSQFQSGETTEHQRGTSQESIEGVKDQDAKKQKTEKNSKPNSRGKSTGAKESSQNEQSSKEDYIHVRARRGQATNSHSLAERVRREKISQRMKYLQDLVPGCDKITGKALMLDEIINYVQSLQRQVEFLSMKLSTVNPDVNIDIDRIMSKDLLHSHLGASAILGFHSGISSSQSQHLSSQGLVQAIHCTDSRIHPVPQVHTPWDDEFQNMIQMGLMSNPTLDREQVNQN